MRTDHSVKFRGQASRRQGGDGGDGTRMAAVQR
jgi:hypothetical protein